MFKQFAVGFLFCSIVLCTQLRPVQSAVSPIGIEVAGLQDQLEKGLRARFPGEFRFIADIVGMVERNELRIVLVQGTFHWVREHKPFVRYPFFYFEQALRKRALEEGVVLPPFER